MIRAGKIIRQMALDGKLPPKVARAVLGLTKAPKAVEARAAAQKMERR